MGLLIRRERTFVKADGIPNASSNIWRLAVNVRAAFVGIQAASQAMKDGGRIILIGSNTAVRTAFPGASVYSMSKAALTGLVRGAAIDLAPRTITVNNIQPG